jgi:hypothetical protein
MARIVHRVEIARRPEDVFADLDDVSKHSEWQEGLVRSSLEGGG